MRAKYVLLGFLAFIIASIGILYIKLPSIIAQTLENRLSQYGIQAEISILELSPLSHMKLKASARGPITFESQSIEVKWNLSEALNGIVPIELFTDSGSFQHSDYNLSGSVGTIEADMLYRSEVLHFQNIRSTLSTSSPFQSTFSLNNLEESKLSNFQFEFEGAAQGINLLQFDFAQKLRLEAPLKIKGAIKQENEIWRGDLQSTHPISLAFVSFAQPSKIKISKLNSKFEWSVESGLSISDSALTLSGTFDELKFNSTMSAKSLKSNLTEGNIKAKVESHWTPKSLEKTFKKYDLHYLEKITGILSAVSTIKLQNKFINIDTSIGGKFKRALLTAVPLKDIDFKLDLNCLQGSTWTCTPKDSKHFLSINSAGDEFPIRKIRFDAETISSAIKGSFSADWLGAKISDRSITGSSLKNRLELKSNLNIDGLELSQLSKVIDMNNLKANGKMNGILGLHYSTTDGLIIPPSKLSSMESGTLRYKDPASVDIPKNIETLKQFNDLMNKGQQALVYKALDNFHYKSLVIEAQRPEPKKLSIKLHLDGSNPDLARGQVFDISIPIEGNLEGLLAESSFQKLAESETSEEYIKKLRKALAK